MKNENNKALIDDLAGSYLDDPNCLVLLCVDMTGSFPFGTLLTL